MLGKYQCIESKISGDQGSEGWVKLGFEVIFQMQPMTMELAYIANYSALERLFPVTMPTRVAIFKLGTKKP